MKKLLIVVFIMLIFVGKSFGLDGLTSPIEFDNVVSGGYIGNAPVLAQSRKVAIVDKSGLHYPDPVAAMDDIATWCGVPSETNLCLIRIMPGIYDLGTRRLNMQRYVDVEGSGENTTKILGQGYD